MKVWLESIGGTQFPVEVGDSGTLQELKEKAHKTLDIPIARQILILSFNGNILRQDTDLVDVKHGSVIEFRILPPPAHAQQPISAAQSLPLTDLPLDVVANIQSHFCNKDGARSCLLSKTWNRAWLSRLDIRLEEAHFEETQHFLDYVDRVIESHRLSASSVLDFLVCDVFVQRISTAEIVAAKYLKERSSNIRITFIGDFTADIPPVCRVVLKRDWIHLKSLYLNNVCLEHFENIHNCEVLKTLALVDCRRSYSYDHDRGVDRSAMIKIRSASIEKVDVRFSEESHNWRSYYYTTLFNLPTLREFNYIGSDSLHPHSFEAGMEGCETYIHLDMEGFRGYLGFRDLWENLMPFDSSNIILSLSIGLIGWTVKSDYTFLPAPTSKCNVGILRIKPNYQKFEWEILNALFRFVRPSCIAVTMDGNVEFVPEVLEILNDYYEINEIECVGVQQLEKEVMFNIKWAAN